MDMTDSSIRDTAADVLRKAVTLARMRDKVNYEVFQAAQSELEEAVAAFDEAVLAETMGRLCGYRVASAEPVEPVDAVAADTLP